jgi:hypothetical protein
MTNLVRLESIALFIASLFLFNSLGMSWWWYAGFILVPDASMIGYLVSSKVGAYTYNLFHHMAVGISIYFIGYLTHEPLAMFAGVILFSHSTLDRIFGYGLKYEKGFKFTHLSEIGK